MPTAINSSSGAESFRVFHCYGFVTLSVGHQAYCTTQREELVSAVGKALILPAHWSLLPGGERERNRPRT